MTSLRALFTCLFLLTAGSALAGAPMVGSPLPELNISDRGELVPKHDVELRLRLPWSLDQYRGA